MFCSILDRRRGDTQACFNLMWSKMMPRNLNVATEFSYFQFEYFMNFITERSRKAQSGDQINQMFQCVLANPAFDCFYCPKNRKY